MLLMLPVVSSVVLTACGLRYIAAVSLGSDLPLLNALCNPVAAEPLHRGNTAFYEAFSCRYCLQLLLSCRRVYPILPSMVADLFPLQLLNALCVTQCWLTRCTGGALLLM